jgi:hypothetical protein
MPPKLAAGNIARAVLAYAHQQMGDEEEDAEDV